MTKIERLCFLTAPNPCEVTHYFAYGFADAWKRHGVETLSLDLSRSSFFEREKLESLLAWKPTLTCSFNTLSPMKGGLYFCDVLKIPHWAITVDPAPYRLQFTQSPYTIISCCDYSDCEFMKSLGVNRSFFLPHGFPAEIGHYEEGERCYDIVFVGSCHDYEGWRTSWKESFSIPEQQILNEAIERADASPLTPYIDLLGLSLLSHQLEPSDHQFVRLFHEIHRYLRSRERVNLMRSIRHLPLHIFGEFGPRKIPNTRGWTHYLAGQENVIIHPTMATREMSTILQKSKIGLNSTPFFRNGSHERLLEIMACGALAVTSENAWTRNSFSVDEELLIYNEKFPPGELEDTLSSLLNDEPRRRAIAERGRKASLKDHTWDSRVITAIKNLEAIELPTPVQSALQNLGG